MSVFVRGVGVAGRWDACLGANSRNESSVLSPQND